MHMAWRLKGEQFEPIIRLNMISHQESDDFIDLDHVMAAEMEAEMVDEMVVEADREGHIAIIETEIINHVTVDRDGEIAQARAAEDEIDHPTIDDEKTEDEIEADPVLHHRHNIDDDDQDHHPRHADVRF